MGLFSSYSHSLRWQVTKEDADDVGVYITLERKIRTAVCIINSTISCHLFGTHALFEGQL